MDGIDWFFMTLPYLIVAAVAIWVGMGIGYYTACKDEEERQKKEEAQNEHVS